MGESLSRAQHGSDPMTTRHRTKPWQPLSLHAYLLTCMMLATAMLLGTTVWLHYVDSTYKRIFPGPSGNGLSERDIFNIRTLPTIVIVLYGIWITVLDLDVKRLEPWRQLSLKHSARSGSPLICRYDTDFILSVLARAFKKRYELSVV